MNFSRRMKVSIFLSAALIGKIFYLRAEVVSDVEEVLIFSDQLLKMDNLTLEKEQVRMEKLDFQTWRKLIGAVVSSKTFALRYVKEANKNAVNLGNLQKTNVTSIFLF